MPAPTWTYAYNYTLARDRIRLLIGDTDSVDKLIYDEEIAQYVSADGDAQSESADYLSAAKAAGVIARKFARQVQSISAGGTSVVFGSPKDRADAFFALEKTLAKGPVGVAPRPFLGGQAISDKLAREADTDRVAPSFTRARTDSYERSDLYGDYS